MRVLHALFERFPDARADLVVEQRRARRADLDGAALFGGVEAVDGERHVRGHERHLLERPWRAGVAEAGGGERGHHRVDRRGLEEHADLVAAVGEWWLATDCGAP